MFDSTISVSSDLELCSKRLEFELTYSTLNLDGGLKEKEELLDSCTAVNFARKPSIVPNFAFLRSNQKCQY